MPVRIDRGITTKTLNQNTMMYLIPMMDGEVKLLEESNIIFQFFACDFKNTHWVCRKVNVLESRINTFACMIFGTSKFQHQK